jgi:hypothetical protein
MPMVGATVPASSVRDSSGSIDDIDREIAWAMRFDEASLRRPLRADRKMFMLLFQRGFLAGWSMAHERVDNKIAKSAFRSGQSRKTPLFILIKAISIGEHADEAYLIATQRIKYSAYNVYEGPV